MKCSKCGAQLDPNGNCCPICGTPVQPNPQQQGDVYQSAYQGYDRNSYGPYQYRPPYPKPPVSGTPYLVWAIIVTIFCFLPLGIPAIIYAAKIDTAVRQGDIPGAMDNAKKAKTFTILSAVIGVVLILMAVAALVGVTIWSFSPGFYHFDYYDEYTAVAGMLF